MATLSTWGYQPIAAATGEEAVAILQGEGAPCIAILDWEMPGMSGPDVCRAVRALPSRRYAYILLVTARGSREDLIGGMDAGADDYLVKPVDAGELRVRLRAGRRVVDLQTELLRARDELEHRATHDALTGVWNRGGIMERLGAEVSRARRDGRPLSIALLDLDEFKRINDTRGHAAGDDVLREVGVRLPGVLRTYDLVGRYGGEEFLLVLPGASAHACGVVAERVRADVAGTTFATRAGPLPVTASIGTVTLTAGSREDVDALVARADAALYQAKRGGRNRVVAAICEEDPAPRPGSGTIAARVHARLREVLGDDARDEIASLIDEYVVSAMHEVHAMRSAARLGNFQQMRRHAHALKGSSANFGVEQIAALAAEIELTPDAPAETLDRLGALVDDMSRELAPDLRAAVL